MRIGFLVGLALPALATAACNRGLAAPDGSREPPPSSAVPVARVRAAVDLALLEAPAEVQAPPEALGVIAPPASARVLRLFVRPGERVARGAPIARVLVPSVVTAAGQHAAAHTRMAAYAARKAKLEELRAEGLVRASEVIEVDTRLAEARADAQAAEAALRSAGLQPDALSLDADGALILRSPVAGVVTEVAAAVGVVHEPGTPLARVVGEGRPRIEARLAHRVPTTGVRFEFTAPGRPPVPLALVTQAPVADPRDGTIPTWFEPPAGVPLPHGLRGRVRILVEPGAGAVAVPARAVAVRGGRSFVLLRERGAERPVAVEVFAASATEALVRGPLQPGQEIAPEVSPATEGPTEPAPQSPTKAPTR